MNGVFRYAMLFCLAFSNLSVTSGFKSGGGCLAISVRILIVEDHELFRRFICSTLGERSELQIIGEASDGLEAVLKTEELHPDLILLDIGLPSLNGIEAARRIHKLSPESKILFVSQESSADVVREALGTGASGYVVKSDAGRELLEGVKAVLRGELFIGERFSGHCFVEGSGAVVSQKVPAKDAFAPLQRRMEIDCRHEVCLYSDDASLLDGFTQFIGAALKSGSAVIVIATESHRDGLLPRLQAHGLDIGAAIEQGTYISLDAAQTLSTFMVNDQPDPVRFQKSVADTIMTAAKAVKGERPRVVACGECAPLLWARGNAEAAIRVEHLWDEIAKIYSLDTLCGYPLGSLQAEPDSHIFQRICAAHSDVHSQ
jgi:DNA-binding NarL/FixJ family response regulator